MKRLFGGGFDLNKDGKVDLFESSLEYEAIINSADEEYDEEEYDEEEYDEEEYDEDEYDEE